jgi:hypothetical protein
MTITLTPRDFSQQIIYFYFFGHKKWKFYRPVMGCLCILSGIFLLSGDDGKFWTGYGGFALGYGIYYLTKPFLYVLIKKHKTITADYEFVDNSIIINDRLSTSTLNLAEFPIQKNSKYYYIRINISQRLFFPISKLSEKEINEFEARMLRK